MPDLDFAKVVGRFGLVVGDTTGDPDDDPDIIWCDEGRVLLTPLNTFMKVTGGSPVPWTGGNAVIECEIDANGHLTYHGKQFLHVVDLTSSKVNPQIAEGKATHKVAFRDVKANGTAVPIPDFTCRLVAAGDGVSPGGVNDLTVVAPVAASPATPIYRGEPGIGITGAAIIDGGNLQIELTDGSTVDAGELPVGPGGSNAGVAGYVGVPGGPTREALNARFVQGVQLRATPGVPATARHTIVVPAVGSGALEVQLSVVPKVATDQIWKQTAGAGAPRLLMPNEYAIVGSVVTIGALTAGDVILLRYDYDALLTDGEPVAQLLTYTVFDSGVGADGPIGSTTTGQTWSNKRGSVWSRVGGTLRKTTSGAFSGPFDCVTVASGLTNFVAEVTIGGNVANGGFVFRWISNNQMLFTQGDGLYLFNNAESTGYQVLSKWSANAPGDSHHLRVIDEGVEYYRKRAGSSMWGKPLATVIEPQGAGGVSTAHGLYDDGNLASVAPATFTNYSLRAVS